MSISNAVALTADIPFHAYGTDVSFNCTKCGHPVLATLGGPPGVRRGDNANNATQCRGCQRNYWVEVLNNNTQLRLHVV